MNIYQCSVVLESKFQLLHPDQVLSCCLLVLERLSSVSMKSREDTLLAAESLVSEALFARLKFLDVDCVSESSSG